MEGVPPAAQEVVLEHLYLPENQPPVSQSAAIAEDTTFWILRERFPESEREILVLDRDLRPLATVAVPASSTGPASRVGRDAVWFRELGEFDVPYLVRYRIRRD